MQAMVDSENTQRDQAQRLRAQLTPAVQQLTDGYKMSCYWFEIFECLRKLLLLGGPIFFQMGSASQLVVGLLVCFISSSLNATYSPYIDEDDGRLAELCQLSLFFVLVSTIALRMEGQTSADTLGILLVVTLFVPPAFAFLLHSGVLKAKARVANFCALALGLCFVCAERTTAASRESTPTDDVSQAPPRTSLNNPRMLPLPPAAPVETNSASQKSGERLSGIVGRARADSLADDASASFLAVRSSAPVASDPGATNDVPPKAAPIVAADPANGKGSLEDNATFVPGLAESSTVPANPQEDAGVVQDFTARIIRGLFMPSTSEPRGADVSAPEVLPPDAQALAKDHTDLHA